MSALPDGTQILAGQLQDALTVWRSRPAGVHHHRYRDANVEATRLCRELAAVFIGLSETLTAELGAYDDERRKGT